MLLSRIALILLIPVLFPLGGMAQKGLFTFSHLSTADGLAHSNVSCTFRDSRGFVWFGTEGGLNRYDGYRMIQYKNIPGDPHSLSNNFVKDIIETSDGDLWIGTLGGGVDHFSRKKNEFVTYRNKVGDETSLSNDYITDLMLDHTGKIWVSTSNGLSLFNPASKRFTSFYNDPQNDKSISENQPIYAFEDSRYNIWIATTATGLERYDTQTKTFHHYRHHDKHPRSLSSDRVLTVFEDSHRQLWVGTEGQGLNKMDPTTGECVIYKNDKDNPGSLVNDVIFSITEDDSQNLWIGTENGGISMLDLKTNKFHNYRSNELDNSTLTSNAINSVYKDTKGNIWIATYNAGIDYVTKMSRTFTHYRHIASPNSLNNNHLLSMIEDRDHNLWIGTDGGGLNMMDKKTGNFKHYLHDATNPQSIGGDHVLALLEDAEGNLWMGSWGGGVTVYNPKKNSFKHYLNNPADTNSISGNNVWVIFQDHDKNIWIGAQERGLDRLNLKTGKFTHYFAGRDGLNSNSFISMMQEKDGTLWVGTANSGLNKFDSKANRFIPLKYEENYIDNSANSLYEDGHQRLWVATNNGLQLMDRRTNKVRSWHVKDGLPGEMVFGILEDRTGNLWLSTNAGISKFNPEKNSFRNYDISDGLQANEFKQAFCKTADGKMYFGGDNGFNEFDPLDIPELYTEPNLVFTDFLVFNKSVAISKGPNDPSPLKVSISEATDLVIEYKNSLISFDFASLEFYSTQEKRYQYRMVGFDETWNDIGSQHTATYTNLDPGKYVFEVKTLSSAGTWSSKTTTINVTILPPFYMTWWFRTLVSVLIVLAVVGYFRHHMANINKQKHQLEVQVMERTAQLELSSEEEKKARLEAEKARVEAEKANMAKSVFLATMSHEIRTPMNGVIGMASLLNKTALTAEQKTYAETISTCGDALLTVINDILDFSKIESGHLELENRAFDLRMCIEEVLDIFAEKASQTNIELIYEIDARVPVRIMGDHFRLRQILINLVGNAMKFTHEGEVLVQVKPGAMLPDHQLELTFNIIDTGIGIPQHKIHTLFQSFAQVDSSTTRKYGGTGLGLVICKKLVTLMKGSISVESGEGKGSIFSFTIQTMPVMTPEIGGNSAASTSLNGKQILIVDDNTTNRHILQHQLAEWKIGSVLAASGKEALDIISHHKEIDLVLTDMHMPEMDGVELTREIKKINPNIPVILLSSVTFANVSEHNDLFYCTLSKPVKQQILLKHLEPALNNFSRLKILPERTSISSFVISSIYPLRILVAEDNQINQLLIQKMLDNLGYQAVIVENGKLAVDKLTEEHFDIVFMDVQMPEMDGFEATKAIRTCLKRQPVIVAVTANAMQGDEQLCKDAGMDDYITKPLKIDVLQASIVKWATAIRMRSAV